MVDTRRTSGGNKSTRLRSTSNSNRAGGEIYDFGALDQFEKNKRLANQSKRNASNTSCDDNSNDQNGIPGSIVESRIVKFSNLLPIGKKIDCPVYGYIFKKNPIPLGNMSIIATISRSSWGLKTLSMYVLLYI